MLSIYQQFFLFRIFVAVFQLQKLVITKMNNSNNKAEEYHNNYAVVFSKTKLIFVPDNNGFQDCIVSHKFTEIYHL